MKSRLLIIGSRMTVFHIVKSPLSWCEGPANGSGGAVIGAQQHRSTGGGHQQVVPGHQGGSLLEACRAIKLPFSVTTYTCPSATAGLAAMPHAVCSRQTSRPSSTDTAYNI